MSINISFGDEIGKYKKIILFLRKKRGFRFASELIRKLLMEELVRTDGEGISEPSQEEFEAEIKRWKQENETR